MGLRWSEVDRAAKVWLIPDWRMKGKRAHLVLLSGMAMNLLDEAAKLTRGERQRVCFPVTAVAEARINRRAFSRAMNRVVAVLRLPTGAKRHHLRRTGATIMTGERLSVARFVVSQVLAHSGDTGGGAMVTTHHYDVNDYLREKRHALDAWANLLEGVVNAP